VIDALANITQVIFEENIVVNAFQRNFFIESSS